MTAPQVNHLGCQDMMVMKITALDCSCAGEGRAQTTREVINPVQILVRKHKVLVQEVIQGLQQIQLCTFPTVNQK